MLTTMDNTPIRTFGPNYRIDVDGDGIFDTLELHKRSLPNGEISLELWKTNGEDQLLGQQMIQNTIDNHRGFDPMAIEVPSGKISMKVAAGDLTNPHVETYSDGQLNDRFSVYADGHYELRLDNDKVITTPPRA